MSCSIRVSLCLFLFGSLTAPGQTSRGTISGIVVDQTGAAIVDAKVELLNLEQNTMRSTQSNEAGVYRFDAVDPGQYRVRVIKGGFSIFQTSPFPVTAAQVARVDVKLEVGQQASTIEVQAESVALQTDAAVRLNTIAPVQAVQLPIATRNPVALALTLPGISSNRGGFGVGTFSVNGGRGRSNNFLLDGTENNDISVAGQAFQVTNPDAVQEVAVQASNFDAEFGRAGGAVINTITKSGSNDLRGSASYLVESTWWNAITNTEALNRDVQQRGRPLAGTDQWFSGTLGGPIRKNQTFFFGAYQERRQQSTSTTTLNTLSAAGRATLRAVFPPGASPNVDTYLKATEGAVANSQFGRLALGAGRPDVEIGTVVRGYAQRFRSSQPIIKIDHQINERNLLMGRYALDDQSNPFGSSVNFPGFDTSQVNRYQNALLSYTRILSPSLTNELRLPYNRITLDFPNDATNPLGQTLPQITIAGLTAVGVASNRPQGRVANNYGLQDTVTWVRGRHSIRFGADLLLQRARQFAPFSVRGTIAFQAGGGFTPLGNFVDDFGGSGGSATKDFGSPAYYPNLFRNAYFFQDRWRVHDSLTLTLGIRYEYFGLPMNSLRTPAFTGLFNIDPVNFTGPFTEANRVQADRNNWAPTVGLAWSPSYSDGLLGRLLGSKKFVWRMGYQMGYDSFFNNIASNAQSSSPNLVSTATPSVVDATRPRGLPNFSSAIPTQPRALLPIDSQTLMIRNLVNPYYQRWSAGFQRNLPADILLDASYVGSKGTRLYIQEDFNPLVPPNFRILPQNVGRIPYATQGRLDNLQGARTTRTNGGSSTYHSLQIDARRRFAKGLMFTGAYTWSKFLDNGSEIFAWGTFTIPSIAAVPSIFGGQPLERSLSAFDRTHRGVLTWVYDLPFQKAQTGFLGRVIGGWQVSGVATFESGVPLTIVNGLDADGFGGANDRPDFNPFGRPGTRAVISAASPTGYVDPDAANAPIARSDAMFIQLPACNITANPNGCPTGTLGRNTWRGPGINNFNVNIAKRTRMTERVAAELRAEFFNFFNHPQYGSPGSGAFQPGTPALQSNVQAALPGRFLNPTFMDGGARAMRLGLKLMF